MENMQIFFERYIKDEMSLSKLLRIVLTEINGYECNNMNTEIERLRKKLKIYLKNLEMDGVIQNSFNKGKKEGRKRYKVHSIYQCLFFRRLLLDQQEKGGIIEKIQNGKLRDITEDELNKFCERIKKDFDLWFELYRNDNKLNKDYDIQEVLERLGSINKINETDTEKKQLLDELYMDPQKEDFLIIEYEKMKMQTNIFLFNMKSILKNKCELDRMKNVMTKEIWKSIEKVFQLESINNLQIETLDEYESPIFGTLDMPISLLNDKEKLIDEQKLFLLRKFNDDLELLLSRWEKYVNYFPRMLELQREDFVNKKSDIKPDLNVALLLVKRVERKIERLNRRRQGKVKFGKL